MTIKKKPTRRPRRPGVRSAARKVVTIKKKPTRRRRVDELEEKQTQPRPPKNRLPLTPDEQVRRALSIINPRPELRQVVKEEIEDVLTHFGDDWYGLPVGERNKRVNRFRGSLRRVQIAIRKMQGAFPDADVAAIEDITQRLLLATDDLLTPGRPKRNSNKQQWAAEEALRLLLWTPRLQWPIRAVEGSNPLLKLAAVIYGYADADLRRYCWKAINRHRRGSPTLALSPNADHASPVDPLWEAVIERLRPKAKAAKKPGSK